MHDVHCLSELVERLVIISRPEDAATQTWPRWSAGLRPQERHRYSNMETVVDQGIKQLSHTSQEHTQEVKTSRVAQGMNRRLVRVGGEEFVW